ncbi:hypothetical protein GCM10010360_44900 [Streptomyces nogalater]
MTAGPAEVAATMGPFLGLRFTFGRFVRSYECFTPPDTGKSTKRPAVSNDTGSPDGPLGTGGRPDGSVRGESRKSNLGNAVVVRCVLGEEAHDGTAVVT